MEAVMNGVKVERYPQYKDSGFTWIGEIPVHWKVEKGKWLFQKENRLPKEGEGVVTAFRDGQVTLRSNRREDGFTNAIQEHGYQCIRQGDLVIHAMDAFAGAIGVSDSDGKSSPVYAACTARKKDSVDPYFYAYFLRNLAKTGFIESLAKGIRERSTDFRYKDFGLLELPLPPLPEQTAIANFLDKKTAQIDQAIAQKERLIALLKERRQILIHKAVTRGLNPDVKMKDSGVEWIGEVPEHWEVKRIKHLLDIKGGFAFDSSHFKDEGVQLIRIANTYLNELCLDRQPVYLEAKFLETHREWIVTQGDILLSLTGTLGKRDYGFAILLEADEKYLLNQRVAKITPKDTTNTHYILNILHSEMFLNQLYTLPAGTKQANLSNNDILNIKVAFPKDSSERCAIRDFVSNLKERVATIIQIEDAAIQKLKEYKATLINAAVTGKIKLT